jgi:HK97 family phage portal protein
MSLFYPETRNTDWHNPSNWGNPDNPLFSPMCSSRKAYTSTGQVISEQTILACWAFTSCILLKARIFAKLPARFIVSDTNTSIDHQLSYTLNQKPNQNTTAFSFNETMSLHCDWTGNAYAIINRNRYSGYTELWQVPSPGQVVITRAKNNMPVEFNCEVQKGALVYEIPVNGKRRKFRAKDVLHIANASLDNGIIGTPTIELLKVQLTKSLSADRTQLNYLGTGVQAGGVLSFDDYIGEDVRAKWHEEMNAKVDATDKSKDVMILDGGAKYTQFGMNFTDAQFFETYKFTEQQICGYFGIPSSCIGIYDSNANRNNLEETNKMLKTYCISPWTSRFENSMDDKLLSESDKEDGIEIQHDFKSLDRADIATETTWLEKMVSIGMPPNVGLAYMGMQPVEGGDQPFVSANLLPIDYDRNQQPEQPESPETDNI